MEQNQIICRPLGRVAMNEAVSFEKGTFQLLELRVSIATIVNQPSGLDFDTVHDWLEKVGRAHIEDTNEGETVIITAVDVINGELVTPWNNLTRI